MSSSDGEGERDSIMWTANLIRELARQRAEDARKRRSTGGDKSPKPKGRRVDQMVALKAPADKAAVAVALSKGGSDGGVEKKKRPSRKGHYTGYQFYVRGCPVGKGGKRNLAEVRAGWAKMTAEQKARCKQQAAKFNEAAFKETSQVRTTKLVKQEPPLSIPTARSDADAQEIAENLKFVTQGVMKQRGGGGATAKYRAWRLATSGH